MESRDWGGFGAILNEARAIDAELRSAPRPDCPLCGLILQQNSTGAVDCPMGHYTASARPSKADPR